MSTVVHKHAARSKAWASWSCELQSDMIACLVFRPYIDTVTSYVSCTMEIVYLAYAMFELCKGYPCSRHVKMHYSGAPGE
jgi:hypothetical protein